MITDEDIKKMLNVFSSKEDLRKLEEKINDNVDEKVNRVYNLTDQVLKELKDMRMEQSAHTLRHDDIDKDLTAIKAIPIIAHELKRKKD